MDSPEEPPCARCIAPSSAADPGCPARTSERPTIGAMTSITTIEAGRPIATLINVFRVAPERQAELAGLLTRVTEETMQHQAGFISANIHLSTDGESVVNYAQWETEQHFQAMPANAVASQHMAQAAEIALNRARLFTVESRSSQVETSGHGSWELPRPRDVSCVTATLRAGRFPPSHDARGKGSILNSAGARESTRGMGGWSQSQNRMSDTPPRRREWMASATPRSLPD